LRCVERNSVQLDRPPEVEENSIIRYNVARRINDRQIRDLIRTTTNIGLNVPLP
jgi:hypothetical protein